ncbi:hypothetical protein L9F63_020071, partial [Diploptera punctata]
NKKNKSKKTLLRSRIRRLSTRHFKKMFQVHYLLGELRYLKNGDSYEKRPICYL